jgi:transcriptional regulator with XRE-family HTH domain
MTRDTMGAEIMTKDKTAAEIFKDARLKKGLTQVEVAKKAGLYPNAYAKIERGISKPSPTSIKKLIKALDIEPSKILYLLD